MFLRFQNKLPSRCHYGNLGGSFLLIERQSNLLGISDEIIFVADSFTFSGIRKKPDVGMLDFFAGDSGPNAGLIKSLLLRPSNFFCHFKISTDIWRVPHPTEVSFRNYLTMARRTGLDVEEGEEVVILINNLGGNFFRHDFTKNTFRHDFIIC